MTLLRCRHRLPAGRHPMTRTEAKWFRVQARHAQAFGTPDACRLATLAVFNIDLLEHRSVDL